MRSSLLITIAIFVSIGVFCQPRKVTGRILNSRTQKPLKNANISIVGTTQGTRSNHLGYFELEIDDSVNQKLVISHIGFETSEIVIPKEDRFKVFLEQSYVQLNKLNLNRYPVRGMLVIYPARSNAKESVEK